MKEVFAYYLKNYLSLYFIYGFQLKLYWKIILIRSLLLLLLRLVNMSRISLKSCHGFVFTNTNLNEISHSQQSLLLLLFSIFF